VASYQAISGAIGKPGDVLLQLWGQAQVLGMTPEGSWYYFSTGISGNAAGISVEPLHPDQVVLRHYFTADATYANVHQFTAAGTRTDWGKTGLSYSPRGGAFQPGTSIHWAGTTGGKLVRNNGVSDASPQTKTPMNGASALGTNEIYSIAFGPDGDLYILYSAGVYRIQAQDLDLAAPPVTLVATLGFSTLSDIVYDGSKWMYVSNWTGVIYRLDPLTGSSSTLLTLPSTQAYGLALGLTGDLWAACSNATPNRLTKVNLRDLSREDYPLPSSVGGYTSIGGPFRMAVIGLALPHAGCLEAQSTPVATATYNSTSTSTVTPSNTPSSTPSPSFTSSPSYTPSMTQTPACDENGENCVARVGGGSKAGAFVSWLPKDKDLIVAPNPSRGQATAAFRLPKPGRARVSVFDLTGVRVRVMERTDLRAGEHHWPLDLEGLASGLYVVVVEGDSDFGPRALAQFKLAVMK
jgi:hypothetical protein